MKGSELHNVVTVTVLGKSLRVTCAFEIGPFKCSQVIEEISYLVIKSKEVEMVKNCDVLSVEMRQLVREIVRRKNIPDTLSLSLCAHSPLTATLVHHIVKLDIIQSSLYHIISSLVADLCHHITVQNTVSVNFQKKGCVLKDRDSLLERPLTDKVVLF